MHLEKELLRTLSFYDPMSLEHIFLDLDKSYLDVNEDLTTEDLLKSLDKLTTQNLIKVVQHDDQKMWIRVAPKKSIFSRLKRFISTF